MLQRVGLAQALINEPEIVFLDEPMSGLDPIGRREIRELMIGSSAERGTTVFMSTHILSDVEALCDEVAILRRRKTYGKGKSRRAPRNPGRTAELRGQFERHQAGHIRKGFEPLPNPTGVTVKSERRSRDRKSISSEARAVGGQIVSVQTVRQSLEELFVESADAGDDKALSSQPLSRSPSSGYSHGHPFCRIPASRCEHRSFHRGPVEASWSGQPDDAFPLST